MGSLLSDAQFVSYDDVLGGKFVIWNLVCVVLGLESD